MADLRSKEDEALPPPPPPDQRDGAGSLDTPLTSPPPASDAASSTALDNAASGKMSVDNEADSSYPPPPPSFAPQPPSAPSSSTAPTPEQLKQVDGVLKSEIGISTLLNRLKHSIASAREFALFLKKRATLEEDNAQGLKKVCRMTQENMRRPEHRQGTFSHAYDEMVYIHERMAENGTSFAASLQQMHDDLVDFASGAERSRKNWKTNGLAAEQKVADLEQTMRKSKAKYDFLAEDYDRVRTGESRQTGKVFNAFKNKSAHQQEEDLLKKVQAADQTYHSHVQTLQTEKSHLVSTTRPEAIKALQDLIKEIDAGLSLQMQKFAAFNEKLLLSNGLNVSPIQGPGGTSSKSLRHAVLTIDNEKDLNDYLSAQYTKVPATSAEVKYERNHVLNPQPSHMTQPTPQGPPQGPPSGGLGHHPPQSFGVQHPPQTTGQVPVPGQPLSMRSSTGGGLGPPGSSFGPPGTPQGPLSPAGKPLFSSTGPPNQPQPFSPHNRSFSQGNMMQQHLPPKSPAQQAASPYRAGLTSPQGGAPQLGALPFQGQPPHHTPQPSPSFQPSHERQGSGAAMGFPSGVSNSSPSRGPPHQIPPPPQKPVFGVHLSRLYERDGLAVPLVVYQCIQAVDLFGLGVEGIYRQSGSKNHIEKLKHMFDTESQNKTIDFRNPEKFYHDVNSVTGLLKQFLRELPEPLLTSEHHDGLVAAAKHEDDIVRRDSVHAIINSLPDPNYATLRALCLHLFRVIDNAHVNRMNSHNLAVIFGPTLMGTDPTKAIADAGWQIKVVDTILQNTYQIFDED